MPLSDLANLVVVLVRPRNPLNIGAVARAMSNFGAHRLRLVNPYEVAFRDARSAVGASELLQDAREFTAVADAVADCSLVIGTTAVGHRALRNQIRTLDEPSGALVRSHLQTGCAALLFGSEKTGLSNDDFSHCHWLLKISMKKSHVSMNLGQAVAVCLYELARSSPVDIPPHDIQAATADQTELITENLFEALRISGYVKPGTDAMFEKKTRQLILGFNLEPYDAKLLLGMVRQIVWKLRNPSKD